MHDNDIKMYSAHKEGKFVVAAIFIRMLKENISWDLIWSKNVFNYNNKYHRTIKLKPVDVKSSTYTDFNKQNSKENLEFEVDDHVRILNFKPFLSKVYVSNRLKKFLWWKMLKALCRGHMLLGIFTMKKCLDRFRKKNYKKQIKKN